MMQMARLIFDQMNALLFNDPAGFGNVLPPGQVPIGADFTPRPDLVLSDLSIAPAGVNPSYIAGIHATVNFFFNANDPYAWDYVILPSDPGWYFTADGSVIPVTVFGMAFVSNLANDLYAVQKFDPPVTLSRAGQGQIGSNVIFTVSPSVLVN